jgi:diguanylate cyclase (GGDEF)-like protein
VAAPVAHAAPSAPAPSAPNPTVPASTTELFIDGAVELDAEILALVALGAFGDDPPPELVAVHDEWDEFLDGLDRQGLIDWAIDADRRGADVLTRLTRAGFTPSPAIQRALGPLTQGDLDLLATGQPLPGDPLLYVRARGHLDQGLQGTPPASELPGATTGTGEDAGSSSFPVLPVAIGGLAALAVAGAALAARRRGRRSSAVPASAVVAPIDQFDILAEAARRMTGAADEQEVARIALGQAMEMTRARHGAFVTVDEVGLTATATSGDVFAVRSLTGGLLSRVADTGQPVRRIAHDEPSITSLPASVLAAPIIGGGRVNAILFLVRGDSTPFGDADEAAIARLSPVIASALSAAAKHEDAAALSRTDPLTGVANRRGLDDDLARVAAAPATGRSTGVVMVDVDHFKHFNDRNGHSAGDDALRAVARALAAGVREGDTVYRYGGEEFTVLLADVDRDEAERIAERIRVGVARSDVVGRSTQPGGALTVSIGVALVAALDPAAALALADRALYEAKSAGRNRVVVVDTTAPQPA